MSAKAIQVGNSGGIARDNTNNRTHILDNVYYNSSNAATYIESTKAAVYTQNFGTHEFKVAPSGTADTAISWTTAMTLDNSGNVGIGVVPEAWSSSATALQLGDLGALWIYDDNSNPEQLVLSENVYNNGEERYIQTDYASAHTQRSGVHTFKVAPSGTADTAISWTNAMTVDNAGRVTIPYQPYFAAEMNGNSNYVSMAENTVFPFNSTGRNVGSHFNTSNYRFTAPVNGNYSFSAGAITNSGSPVARLQFYVNGGTDHLGIKMGISGSATAGGGSTNTSAIIYLDANDYVDVRSQGGTAIGYQSGHSSFTGILLS